ncbi:DUF308 domain-containing protein [Singulisphaera rosea]
MVAAWAVATGVFEVVVAAHLRGAIAAGWLLALVGILSIGLGVLLILRPESGALAVAWFIGGYALGAGILLLALALRIRSWSRQVKISYT